MSPCHSVPGWQGHEHHVCTRHSFICMCCSLELGLQLPPSILLCNHYQPVFVKYKLQTIQRLKELSVRSHSLS